MASGFQMDHVVIKVNDLEGAMADYRTLGFTVMAGGEHPAWGSRNALVLLKDGTYLELISFREVAEAPRAGDSRQDERMLSRLQVPEGLVDFAVLPEHTGRDLDMLREHGLDYEGPFPGGRLRPDGQDVRWEMGLPDGRDLPFLCGDVTPRHLRVPEGEAHANGVEGIVEVGVAVEDLAFSANRFAILLGAKPDWSASGRAAFVCGSTRMVLSGPDEEAVRKSLDERGVGPWRVGLGVGSGEPGTMDVRLAHGVRFELLSE